MRYWHRISNRRVQRKHQILRRLAAVVLRKHQILHQSRRRLVVVQRKHQILRRLAAVVLRKHQILHQSRRRLVVVQRKHQILRRLVADRWILQSLVVRRQLLGQVKPMLVNV